MSYWQSIILGIIQGATEFIPISSSGHLVIAPLIFGWEIHPLEAFIFDVLAQVATLAAVIVYYWSDLINIFQAFWQGILAGKPFQEMESRLGWYLIVSTVPSGIAALIFKDTFEEAFSNPQAAAYFLLVTSGLLLIGELMNKKSRAFTNINILDSIWIGFFQILALFPGVSRSGSTISGGMLRGLDRKPSARYSFLMAVPVMSAAGVLAVTDLFQLPNVLAKIPIFLAGFIAAAVVGYLSIRWLIRYLSSKPLYIFSIYTAFLGIFVLLVYYI